MIPGYREYILARCAAREKDGRVLLLTASVSLIFGIILVFLPEDNSVFILQKLLMVIIALIGVIYHIRISLGLSEVFGRKKKWAFVWVFTEAIAAIIWGFGKRFKPGWKESYIRRDVDTYFSNIRMDVMKDGLTVNLKKRTTREFLTVKTLLRDIHIGSAPGRMVLLLGSSGAGKTTLLNTVNGYEKADAEVFLNGSNIYSEYKRRQYKTGFVPQQDLMRMEDTVQHTLSDAAALRLPVEFYRADRAARVNDVMGIFGLSGIKDSLVSKLSGGQRKRLSIATEFLSNPSLFILDEPDSGLDGVMARELMEQLRSIADSGKIVIVITHTPDRVIDLFDDVIVLAKDQSAVGRLAWFGPVQDAKDFFGCETTEEIVLQINRKEEGGDGRADEFIEKYQEVQCHG